MLWFVERTKLSWLLKDYTGTLASNRLRKISVCNESPRPWYRCIKRLIVTVPAIMINIPGCLSSFMPRASCWRLALQHRATYQWEPAIFVKIRSCALGRFFLFYGISYKCYIFWHSWFIVCVLWETELRLLFYSIRRKTAT